MLNEQIMEEEIRIRQIIQEVNRVKLIDTISTVFYYFRANGEYENMMLPAELEYIMTTIYNTRLYKDRKPTAEEILEILDLARIMIFEMSNKIIQNKAESRKDVIYNYASESFLYEREDTEYEVLALDYLNLFEPMKRIFYRKL